MMFDASETVFELLRAANRTAAHWRAGGHGHTREVREALLDYADGYFKSQTFPPQFSNGPSPDAKGRVEPSDLSDKKT